MEAAAVAAARQHEVGSSLAAARRQWQHQRRWRQRDSAALAVTAVRQRDVGGSVSGSGGSAKRGSGSQRDGGSALAAARMLRRWRQCDNATSQST
jgi:hypothetical protein